MTAPKVWINKIDIPDSGHAMFEQVVKHKKPDKNNICITVIKIKNAFLILL